MNTYDEAAAKYTPHMKGYCTCDTCEAFRRAPADRPQEMKKDAGKPRFELIDPWFLLELAKVLTFGALKYAAEKWREGINLQRLTGAIQRHMNALQRGEDIDPETGYRHTAHLAAEVMFYDAFLRMGRKDLDDRVKP